MSSCSGNGSYQGRTIGLPWQRECHHEVDTGDSYCHYTGRESSFSAGPGFLELWVGALDIDWVLLTKFLNKSERLSNHHLIILFRYFLNWNSTHNHEGNRAKLFATFSFWIFLISSPFVAFVFARPQFVFFWPVVEDGCESPPEKENNLEEENYVCIYGYSNFHF